LTTGNLIVTLSSNPYNVNISSSTNVNNTIVSNLAFSRNVMTGDSNVAVGHNCLTFQSSGARNTAIGAGTAQNITTGSYNTVLGSRALCNATTDSSNVAIGFEALASSASSTYPSVAVGTYALKSVNNPAGGGNVAVGYNSLTN
jgi:hypothetical protein